MSCFNGGCLKHAKSHFQKRKHQLALNIRRIKKKVPENQEPPAKITKIAIGLPGGVGADSEDMYEYESYVFCFACDKAVDKSHKHVFC
jgi:hypothetical protein